MSSRNFAEEELEIFLEEMDEMLQVLEEDFLKLERQPDNPSILKEIFRAAHTLKGSAATMGFSVLAELAHSMETVFDGVRGGTIPVSEKLIDVFLQCNDTISRMKDEIFQHHETRSATAHHMEALQELMKDSGKKAEKATGGRLSSGKGAVGVEGANMIQIRMGAAETCQLPSVRAFQVVFLLSSHGCIKKSDPNIEEIESEVRSFPLVVDISTDKTVEEMRTVVESVAEIVVLEISEAGAAPADKKPEPAAAPAEPESAPAIELETAPHFEKTVEEENILIDDVIEEQEAEEAKGTGYYPETEAEEEEEIDIDFLIASVMEEDAAKEATTATPEPVKEPEKEPEPEKVVEDKEATPEEQAAPAVATDKDDAQTSKKHSSRTVRVDVERMDAIMDLVGELVINRTRLSQLSRFLSAQYDEVESVESINETADALELISNQLQENIMKARLLPIENVFNKFPRMVRDLARKSGKKIQLLLEGEDTELDRSVLDEIGDPLMHAIRNSVDHGIEDEAERKAAGKSPEGTIKISASHVEDHILIVVEDDGRGIHPEKIVKKAKLMGLVRPEALDTMKENEILNLVFAPGFSTKTEISELSGRGVGMDVVRSNIEKLNGSVSLASVPGDGTKLTIKLPLTLAIIKSLLVVVGGRVFAVPLVSVMQTVRAESGDIQTVKGAETTLFRGSVLPLLRLEDALDIKRKEGEKRSGRFFIVVVSWGGRRVGIVVDRLIGDQEIVIRPLGEYIGEVPGIAGAAILGDGNIALIVDIGGILDMRNMERNTATAEV